jgi:3-hydroxyisobutyrate dehydrogenase
MARIGFIGVGNMGGPMVRNLLKAGHGVTVFDLSAEAVERVTRAGAKQAASPSEAVANAEIVITMLPAGPQVRAVYLGVGGNDPGLIGAVGRGVQLIDCSTIDVATARDVAAAAAKAGLDMLDAPVSGGVGGAEAGTLTFMVGGSKAGFARAQPVLAAMGRTIVHTGNSGNGQAAKICNNMILGISMLGVAEGFVLAERLGLDHQVLFDITSKSSGQCWAITNYCPVPGPVPASPANRNFQAGFTADMMLKDLRLAQDAAHQANAATPLGAEAQAMFTLFINRGQGGLDFSAIIRLIRGEV